MIMSADKADEDSVPAEHYLNELLTKAIELEANVSGKENERNKVSKELYAVWTKIHEAIVNEADLKRKRASTQQLNNDLSSRDHRNKEMANFMGQFNALQKIMGISIVCKPELKMAEITFDDAQNTKVSIGFSVKGITLDKIYPAHPNIEAIRTHLRETGDLMGFLSALRKTLTLQNRSF